MGTCLTHGMERGRVLACSGQCFSSEAWGGRSANRGQCAQACRLPYGLVVNGQLRDLADIKYLLSPQVAPSRRAHLSFPE